jgi:hypothetical protein
LHYAFSYPGFLAHRVSALNTASVFVLAAGTLSLGIFFNWLIEGAKGTL